MIAILIKYNQTLIINIILSCLCYVINFTLASASQKIIINGKVIDKTTGQPLAAANIKVVNSNTGSSSGQALKIELSHMLPHLNIIQTSVKPMVIISLMFLVNLLANCWLLVLLGLKDIVILKISPIKILTVY